jgi:glycosyltransferase involved in cell wall biosynthesis
MSTASIPPFVSVIVPVFDDAERLALCLESLERQTYSKNLYQVIVVDNGSAESVKPVVAGFRQAGAVYENRPGSYAARNTGISLARGDVLAFTDADCIPSQDWIQKGVAALLGISRGGLVAGRIDIMFRDPDHPTAVELYEARCSLRQRQYVEVGGFGATANLFTFREVFDRVAHPARRSVGELYRKVARVIGGLHDLNRKKKVSYIDIGKGFFIDSLPPVRASNGVLSDPGIETLRNKIKIIAVMFFVQYAQVWERVRLKLGVRSKR